MIRDTPHNTTPGPSAPTPWHHRLHACGCVWLLALLLIAPLGCRKAGPIGPDATLRDLEQPIELPDLGGPAPAPVTSRTPHLIVQRLDLPLDQPLDDAWDHIDEQAFPAITRGALHSNGLRIGVLQEDEVAGFAEQMPQVVNLFENQVLTRSHPVAVMQSAPLRAETRFAVDLTLPPRPASEHIVDGREGGQMQLLARLEQEGDRHFVVLTPHLYRPRANDFSPRTLLERELDGRVYNELSVRVELKPDRLIAVGLYWPWPLVQPVPDKAPEGEDADEPTTEIVSDTRARDELLDLDAALTSNDESWDDDPAAPPARVRTPGTAIPILGPSDDAPEPETRPKRLAPELPMHFGRVLLTGTRARKPVQTMLLISIPTPPPAETVKDERLDETAGDRSPVAPAEDAE